MMDSMKLAGMRLIEYSANSPWRVAATHMGNIGSAPSGPGYNPQIPQGGAYGGSADGVGGGRGFAAAPRPRDPQGLIARLMQEEQLNGAPRQEGQVYR